MDRTTLNLCVLVFFTPVTLHPPSPHQGILTSPLRISKRVSLTIPVSNHNDSYRRRRSLVVPHCSPTHFSGEFLPPETPQTSSPTPLRVGADLVRFGHRNRLLSEAPPPFDRLPSLVHARPHGPLVGLVYYGIDSIHSIFSLEIK
jgi:hypothetical protein